MPLRKRARPLIELVGRPDQCHHDSDCAKRWYFSNKASSDSNQTTFRKRAAAAALQGCAPLKSPFSRSPLADTAL